MWSECLLIAAVAIYSANGDCKADLQTFTTCAKDEVTARINAAHNEVDNKDFQAKADGCYKTSSCEPPKWGEEVDADLSGDAKAIWKNITVDWWQKLDNAKRHCVITEVRGDFGKKLEECVAGKIPGFTLASGSQDSFSLDDSQKDKLKKLAEHRLKLEIADTKCDGGKKAADLRQCRKKLRDDNFNKDSCDIRKKCIASISADCQKTWVEKIRSPICTCVTEVAADLRKTAGSENFKADDAVKATCGVELPQINSEALKANPDLHLRVRQFASFHEDRIISFCHSCEGLNM